jgi:hypothetical protein
MGIRIGYLTDEEFFGPDAGSELLSDDEFFGSPSGKPEPTWYGSLGRGFNRAQQAFTMAGRELGLYSDEEAAAAIARDERDAAQFPRSEAVTQGLTEISQADGWGESAIAIITNPRAVLSVISESIPMMAGSAVAGIAGGLGGSLAGPGGTTAGLAGGSGLGSFATEYSDVILEVMQKRGVDLSDEGAVRAALGNEELMAAARERGVARGIPIALFDAISFGIAGKVAGAISRGGSTISRIGGRAAEVGVQSGLGAAGEAGAQIASEGGITNPGDVLLEGAAESVTGLPEVAIGELRGQPAKPQAGRQMTVNDPAINGIPAGELHGQTVTIAPDQSRVPGGMVRVIGPDGNERIIGDRLLVDTQSPQGRAWQGDGVPEGAKPADVLYGSEIDATQQEMPGLLTEDDLRMETATAVAPANDPERLSSPRLTEDDRASPIPNDIIDDGKALIEAAVTGQPPELPQTPTPAPELQNLLTDADFFGIDGPAQPRMVSRRDIATDTAVTSAGRNVPVTYAVVEAAELVPSQRDEGGANPAYPAELQPRDRERGVSAKQVSDIAGKLDPRLVDKSPRASDGAPIVAEDGIVESGNGRVLAIRKAYNENLPTAQAYRDYLAGQGYPVEGMRQPVLVRVRSGEMTPQDRQAFTREANERDTLGMSATERAMADAAALSPNALSLYRGGDIDSAANRDFVRAFMQGAVSANDQAGMVDQSGAMSQEAIRRVQAALLARAYGDSDLVASLVESTDTSIKAIGGALMDVAAEWAQMRSEAQAGTINPDADQTTRLLEGVRLVERARKEGQKLVDLVGQQDIFTGQALHPVAQGFLSLMFINHISWTKPAGRDKIAEALRFYVTEARKTSAGTDLLGETAPPADRILALAKERQYGKEPEQQGLGLGSPAVATVGKDDRAPGKKPAVETRPRPEDAGRAESPRDGDQPAGEVARTDYGSTNKTAGGGQMLRIRQRDTASDGDTEFVLTDEFRAQADAVAADLRKRLDGMGLRDVAVRVHERIRAWIGGEEFEADGRYFRGVIDVALTADSLSSTLDHEAIHAMRRLGLFAESEWSILAKRSKDEWMAKHDIAERYAGFPEWAQVEEGIAHAYADWAAGSNHGSMLTRIFRKVQSFIEALGNALRGAGFTSSDAIFEAAAAGETGSRPRQPRRGGKAFSGLFPTETVVTMDGPREQTVIPGAERVSDRELAERRMQGRMQAKKPQRGVSGTPLFGDEKDQLALFQKPASDNDPRFKLRRAPANQAESQQVMQGFIARGQPIDRAIRLPFDILGGLDSSGRWIPGKRITDRIGRAGMIGTSLGGVIGAGVGSFVAGPAGTAAGAALGGTVGGYLLGAKINANGRFGWLHGIAENARAGLIDRYGLSDEYVAADMARANDKRKTMQQAQDILTVLRNENVGPQEAAVLQAILTGKEVDDKDMTRLAVPIRKAIDDMGAEAVSLGLISAESFERNRGSYLHRVYLKNEVDEGGLAGWVARKMTAKRKKIIGDQLKGRGLFWDIPVDRLMRDVASFKEGRRGTPNNGDKFRVLDEVSQSGDMLADEGKAKTLRRVYLPAGEPVPERYSGPQWQDRGEWEVRRTGQTVTLWRDYTEAERQKMGEIVDARYTIARTFMLMANDLSTGRFYKQVAENENWSRSTPPETKWKESADYARSWNDPEVGWVRVPDTVIADSGGKKRWGALAGKYVRAEIWRDMNELDVAMRPGTWRKLLTQWKLNKTARSPVVHMNNVMSNMMFADLADIRMQDMVRGIRAFVQENDDYKAARDNGAFGSDMIAQEIRDNVLKPILDEISKEDVGASNSFLARAGMMGKIADRLWTWAKAADRKMLDAYQMEDEIFRMATYIQRRELGDSPEAAAQTAREQFLDYDIRAPWINAARNSVFPFISYTYRAVPKLAESLAHRPWKAAKYFAFAYAVNALGYLWDDGDDGEERERASLRDEEQGYTWLGVPRMIRMPYRDQNGMPVFLDVRRWIPSGDIFDTNQGQSAIPIPAPLQFGGPLMLAFEFLLNRQAFTGNDIVNDLTDDSADKAEKVGDWLWKSWMPSAAWVPNSWYWTKVRNAMTGATDFQGRDYSLPEALASSVGVKLKPQDVESGIMWKNRDFKKVQTALRAEMRALGRKRERNLISQSEFDKGAAKIMRKFERLEGEAESFRRSIEPAGATQ